MFLTYRGHRCLSILFSLFIWTGISQSRAEVLGVTLPYRAPKGDYVTQQDRYHTFRIPGMVVTGDGSILAFAEGRRGRGRDPTADENAPIDMVLRRSTDQGRTWESMQVIDSGFRPDGSLVDFADPTPVLDVVTQTVHLFYGQWPDPGPAGDEARSEPGRRRRQSCDLGPLQQRPRSELVPAPSDRLSG